MKATPKEITVSATVDARVQIVKFELSSSVRLGQSQTWAFEGTEEEAEAFRYEQMLKLRQELEQPMQAELDDLFAQKQNG